MLCLGLLARFYSVCSPYQPLILLVGGAPSVRGPPNGIAFVSIACQAALRRHACPTSYVLQRFNSMHM
jgi:hypothetical protein